VTARRLVRCGPLCVRPFASISRRGQLRRGVPFSAHRLVPTQIRRFIRFRSTDVHDEHFAFATKCGTMDAPAGLPAIGSAQYIHEPAHQSGRPGYGLRKRGTNRWCSARSAWRSPVPASRHRGPHTTTTPSVARSERFRVTDSTASTAEGVCIDPEGTRGEARLHGRSVERPYRYFVGSGLAACWGVDRAEITDVIAGVPFTGNTRQVSFFPMQQSTTTAVSKKIKPPEWQGAGCGPRAATENRHYPAHGWCSPLYVNGAVLFLAIR